MEDTSEDEQNINNDEPFDLDELLPHIGEFGKYQKLLLWFICLPACIPCGFCAFNQLFMTSLPEDYWCTVGALKNFSMEKQKELSIPYNQNEGRYSRCTRYAIDWDNVTIENDIDTVQLQDLIANTSFPTETCKEGWEFNYTESSSTIVVEFNLVCDRDIFPTLALVALNLGGPIGVYFFGILNDRLGRKISYFCCLATLLGGSFITAISTNFWVWGASRVIVGTTIPAVYQIPFIIALELVGPHYRSFVTVMTCTFYTFGLMLLALVTYFVRDWILLCWVTSLPFLLYFLYILIMPESPRWLLAKGRLEQALEVLENMARTNDKELPKWFKERLVNKVEANKRDNVVQEEDHFSALDLCRTPNMRLKTFLITLNWFANETVYLGLSYYGPSLGTNPYLSFFLSSLVEIPAYIICWIAMDRFGRRWPMSILMILGGLSCIATVLLPDDAVMETLALYLISKSMLSASFLIIYPFAGELYPTEIRGIGIGFSSYVGGIGLIIIPFVTYLGKENLILPLVIMGCLSVLGGFTGLRLPETLNKKLPVTLEEGEIFGKDWTIADCMKCDTGESLGTSCETVDIMESKRLFTENEEAKTDDDDFIPRQEMVNFRRIRRQTMKRIARQASIMDTQKTRNGEMQLTYWF